MRPLSLVRSGLVRAAMPAAPLLLAACAGGLALPDVPSPAEIPALEARYGEVPDDDLLRLRLALAYRSAERPEEAVLVLEPAMAVDAGDAEAVTLAGAYEDMGRLAEARAIYERLGASSPDEAVRREAERRILALARVELRLAAGAALARENELRATPPEPQVVGVFPFLFGAQDPELAPLARALSELLTVDLSQTDRLRVVERARIQLLLDELALAESDRVDPSTAARSGRLVGAGRIVQGRIDGAVGSVRLEAIPVRVGAEPEQEPGDALLREGELQRLFELQKELAIDLYGAMGIELTAAERERVNRRRTENLQALLYFGYGLGAADAGRLDDALVWFEAALDADEGFDLAEEWRERVEVEREWNGAEDPHRFYRIAAAGGPAPAPAEAPVEWIEVRARFFEVERMIRSPEARDALSEALGVEGLDREGTLMIIIREPGREE